LNPTGGSQPAKLPSFGGYSLENLTLPNKSQEALAKAHMPSFSTFSGGRGVMRCLTHARPLKMLGMKMNRVNANLVFTR